MQTGGLSAPVGGRRPRQEALICGAAALVAILWLHLSASSGYSTDALAYATAIRDGAPLFHPHHLLYQASVLIFARGATLLGLAQPEIVGAYVHNLAWAGIGVYALALLVGRATRRMDIGVWSALVLAATAGVGVFATQNDAYVPALACTIVFLCMVQRFDEERRHRLLLLCGGAWALATLYHQSAVLLAVPLLWWLLAAMGVRPGARAFAAIAVPAAAAAMLAYLLGFALEGDGHSVSAFVRFVLDYAAVEFPLWRNPANFSGVGLYQTLESRRRHRQCRNAAVARACRLDIGDGAGGSIALLLRDRNQLGLASTLGLGVFWTFNLWWLPGEPELAIVPVVFCVLVVALASAVLLRGATTSRRVAIGVCLWASLATIASANITAASPFRTMILPEKLQMAQAIGRANSQKCLVLDEYTVMSATEYFSGVRGVDVRRFLIRYFQEPDPASAPRLTAASCLFVRARWLDPETQIFQYAGRNQPEAWRHAVMSVLAKTGDHQRIAAWNFRSEPDALLGRVLFVSRSDSREMSAEFWAAVIAAVRPPP